jgi:hypothetical protein
MIWGAWVIFSKISSSRSESLLQASHVEEKQRFDI